MKKTLIAITILVLAANCFALELVRQKNVATVIVFPLIDSTMTTALKSSAAGLDSELDQFSNSSDNPDGFTDCTNEATEIGSTGQYYLVLTQGEMNEDYITVQIKSDDALTQVILIRTIIGNILNIATTDDGGTINVASGIVESNMKQISDDSTAADNLEATYDGTGYADDVAPATQLQITTLAGGIAVNTAAIDSTVTEGEETLSYAATASHNDSYYEVSSDSVSNDIDFFLTFNTGSGMNLPVFFHLHGYYEDNNPPASSTLVIQAYDFNVSDWETMVTLSDSAGDLAFELPLHVSDIDPSGDDEGDVRIRFKLSATEVDQNMRIDHATVGYVTGGLTAAAVVNEWETQSQADPSGFHVNLLKVEGSDATTYFESRSLAAADYFLYGSDDVTLADGPHGGSGATLTLESFTVSNPNGDAVTFESTYNDDASGFVVTGAQSGPGMLATGGDDEGPGIKAVGGPTNGRGFWVLGDGTGAGFYAKGGDNSGSGIQGVGGVADGYGMELIGINEGAAMFLDTGAGAGIGFGPDIDIDSDIINRILLDTGELQTDWTNGGRLDLLVDDIIDKVSAIMSKAYTLLTAVGTYDPATDALEAQQENPQAPPIID